MRHDGLSAPTVAENMAFELEHEKIELTKKANRTALIAAIAAAIAASANLIITI
ncbi:MAG: hypothetical protein HY789_06280 [Deltaproteobacteria bacterium]|nr:hypothetical protein [Deltaproteobacteria bacterium]